MRRLTTRSSPPGAASDRSATPVEHAHRAPRIKALRPPWRQTVPRGPFVRDATPYRRLVALMIHPSFSGGVSSVEEFWIVIPGVTGSSPVRHPIFFGCIAQLVEHRVDNPAAPGSTPGATTISPVSVAQLVAQRPPNPKVDGSTPS